MKLHVEIKPLHAHNVFRISRAARAEVQNVFITLEAEGMVGRGEASPNAFYRETASGTVALLESAAPWLANVRISHPAEIARLWGEAWERLAPSRAAQCALDLAFWDWLARRQGVSVAQLALGRPARPVESFCTLGLSEPGELQRKVAQLHGFPLVKIKSDSRADLAPVRAVCESTGARVAVDANTAWEAVDPAAISRELAEMGTLFIEQPLPPGDDERMPQWLADSALPVMADESCVTLEDVERMPGRFSGFNIKLVKCGGLTPALAMARRGRALGLKTMTGCMLESSLLIAAGTVVAQETDFADLDGAWLLRDDPFTGLPMRQGMLVPGLSEPGFGVEPLLTA